jgi:hypothetical protein
MNILLFDTETNGLPKNRFAPPSQTDAFPAVLQLSWAIFKITPENTLVAGARQNLLLALPSHIAWDTGAAAIHGLSEESVRGPDAMPPHEAFLAFREALNNVDCVICHNMAFDKPVVRAGAYAASMRLGSAPEAAQLRTMWPKIQEFCTMENTRTLVGIPSAPEAKHPFKAPRLNELYTWLHGHVYDLSGSGNILHSAAADTLCLARCIAAMLRRGYLTVTPDSRLSFVSSVS